MGIIIKNAFFDEAPDALNNTEARKQVIARTTGDFYTNQALDFTLVRLAGAPPLPRYLPVRPAVMQQNRRVVIIQHPGGGQKKIVAEGRIE